MLEKENESPQKKPATLDELLAILPATSPQRQDGTNAQLEMVEVVLAQHGGQHLLDREKAVVANRLGAYDAADLYKIRAAIPQVYRS